MKKVLTGLALAIAAGSVQAADVSGTVTFTNDYRFRGISQTAGDAAVQGSLDVAFDNGISAGIWGTNLDYGSDDDSKMEIDYYVGYDTDINDDLSYNVTLAYFTYPGKDDGDTDYLEASGSLFYGDLGLTYAYTDDYSNSGESGSYVAVDYSYAINDDISLDLHAGHSFGDYWGDVDIQDYEDYSVGVSGSYAGLDLSAAYLFNSIEDADETNSGAFRNDETLVLTVSRSF